jgi:hypothetical protein
MAANKNAIELLRDPSLNKSTGSPRLKSRRSESSASYRRSARPRICS